jgi:transposase
VSTKERQPVAVPTEEANNDPVKQSWARRRQEKRVRKAKAKERRELLAALAELEGSGQGYFALDKLRRD